MFKVTLTYYGISTSFNCGDVREIFAYAVKYGDALSVEEIVDDH